jgi:hypothetical protein
MSKFASCLYGLLPRASNGMLRVLQDAGGERWRSGPTPTQGSSHRNARPVNIKRGGRSAIIASHTSRGCQMTGNDNHGVPQQSPFSGLICYMFPLLQPSCLASSHFHAACPALAKRASPLLPRTADPHRVQHTSHARAVLCSNLSIT